MHCMRKNKRKLSIPKKKIARLGHVFRILPINVNEV